MPRVLTPPFVWNREFNRMAKALRVEWTEDDYIAASECRISGLSATGAAVALAGHTPAAVLAADFLRRHGRTVPDSERSEAA